MNLFSTLPVTGGDELLVLVRTGLPPTVGTTMAVLGVGFTRFSGWELTMQVCSAPYNKYQIAVLSFVTHETSCYLFVYKLYPHSTQL